MRVSPYPSISHLLVPSTLAVSVLLACAAPGMADTLSAPSSSFQVHRPSAPAAQSVAEASLLKPLPASKEELTFRGEATTRTWTVALGRTEAARTQMFQLALLNAVSLFPERSTIKLSINGIVLATLPAASPDKVTAMQVKIPAGVLVPGLNSIQVSAALTHRVDCSINATYELWASLDPSRTGFLVPKEAASAVRSLDELAVEPLAEDGTTRIHVRMADGADPETIGEAGRLVDMLVRRAGLPRPVVDVGPDLGTGAGFDLVLNTGSVQSAPSKPLNVVSMDDAVTIGRDPSTNRLVVAVSGSDSADIERKITGLAKAPAAQSRAISFDGGLHKTFAQLGIAMDGFTGRHFTSSMNIDLPPDFYPSSDRVRLLIDGSHTAFLVEGSQLLFKVNGALVSSMPLAEGKAERFQHEVVELPLRFFHPGHNDLSIEGTTASTFDQQCDVTRMPHEARLSIAGSSEFEFPDFAHFATVPQIGAALAYDAASSSGTINLYLSSSERGSIGTGLTVLANIATTQDHMGRPAIHLGGASIADAPGIVIAPADLLPEPIAAALRAIAVPVVEGDDGSADATAVKDDNIKPASADAPAGALPVASAGLEMSVRSVIGVAMSTLRDHGFVFGGDRSAETLPATSTSLLVAAVSPELSPAAPGGIELPRFVRDPAHWLVVTAPSAGVYEGGIQRLIADGHWKDFAGQAVSLDLKTDEFRSAQPSRVAYVIPSRFVASDVRPILGGIVSNNIMASIILLMTLMAVLGVSTHLLVRRAGAK